jgi:hypothetical protein
MPDKYICSFRDICSNVTCRHYKPHTPSLPWCLDHNSGVCKKYCLFENTHCTPMGKSTPISDNDVQKVESIW